MGHQQDFLSLHDPPGRASSLGRPNPVSYPVSYINNLFVQIANLFEQIVQICSKSSNLFKHIRPYSGHVLFVQTNFNLSVQTYKVQPVNMFEQINNLFVHTVKRHFSHILYSTGISGIPIIHHPDPRTEYPRYGTCTCKLSEICRVFADLWLHLFMFIISLYSVMCGNVVSVVVVVQ